MSLRPRIICPPPGSGDATETPGRIPGQFRTTTAIKAALAATPAPSGPDDIVWQAELWGPTNGIAVYGHTERGIIPVTDLDLIHADGSEFSYAAPVDIGDIGSETADWLSVLDDGGGGDFSPPAPGFGGPPTGGLTPPTWGPPSTLTGGLAIVALGGWISTIWGNLGGQGMLSISADIYLENILATAGANMGIGGYSEDTGDVFGGGFLRNSTTWRRRWVAGDPDFPSFGGNNAQSRVEILPGGYAKLLHVDATGDPTNDRGAFLSGGVAIPPDSPDNGNAWQADRNSTAIRSSQPNLHPWIWVDGNLSSFFEIRFQKIKVMI